MRSRIVFWAVASTIGRSNAKLRRSPLTAYERAGNVTFRPVPPRRSHTLNPINLSPASGDSPLKWSSTSASFPGGFPRSLAVILIVRSLVVWLVCIVLLLLGTVIGSFAALRNHHEPSRRGQKRSARDPRRPRLARSVSRGPGTAPAAAYSAPGRPTKTGPPRGANIKNKRA